MSERKKLHVEKPVYKALILESFADINQIVFLSLC